MRHCRQKGGARRGVTLLRGICGTAKHKGSWWEGLGGGRREGAGREGQESLLGSRGPVVHFPPCTTQHEGLCHHGNRPAGQEGMLVQALEFLVNV